MFKRYLSSFTHAVSGLRHALANDFGFRKQFYIIGALVTAFIYFLSSLNSTELLFVVLAYLLILITELQNTALEIALDKLHPDLHEAIGISKDMAAAAVLLAGLFLLFVLGVILYSHF
jgi:diacylglycerol kinase (ATP)